MHVQNASQKASEVGEEAKKQAAETKVSKRESGRRMAFGCLVPLNMI